MTHKYVPPKVWTMNENMGGRFSIINRPTAGARSTKELPVGTNPLQLYSCATPNGVKVTIMLEELNLAGIKEAEYDAAEFLAVDEYKNVLRWADMLLEREGILRGRLVNRAWGDSDQQLKERHSEADFAGLDLSYR